MPVLHTIGHSARSAEVFLALLKDAGVATVVDVRRIPASRRHPQFGKARLAQALAEQGLGYSWAEALGGHREPRPDSPHTGWTEPAFVGYADHMGDSTFVAAAQELLRRARRERLAVMCAEADPYQCHRQLLADWLVAQGAEVVHLLDADRSAPHRPTPFGRVENGRVVYDDGQLRLV